jgi:hypothetical protein
MLLMANPAWQSTLFAVGGPLIIGILYMGKQGSPHETEFKVR